MKTLSAAAFAFILSLAPASPSHPAGDPKPPAPDEGNYSLGEERARQGKWAEAAALFARAAEEDPRHYRALNMLGYSLRRMGRTKEALAAYDRALAIKPDYAPALEYRGVAHVMAGNKAAARADYEKLKSLGSPLAADLREKIMAMPAN